MEHTFHSRTQAWRGHSVCFLTVNLGGFHVSATCQHPCWWRSRPSGWLVDIADLPTSWLTHTHTGSTCWWLWLNSLWKDCNGASVSAGMTVSWVGLCAGDILLQAEGECCHGVFQGVPGSCTPCLKPYLSVNTNASKWWTAWPLPVLTLLCELVVKSFLFYFYILFYCGKNTTCDLPSLTDLKRARRCCRRRCVGVTADGRSHGVVSLVPGTYSSCFTDTLMPLISSSACPSPSPWQPLLYSLVLWTWLF